jgi:hypothetical protein
MQRRGNYCNKRPHNVNEFNGMTLVETPHFAIKIVFNCNILLGRRRRSLRVGEALYYFLYRNAKPVSGHRTSAHDHCKRSPPPPMPPHVLTNIRGFPPGCGDSVADF